MEHFTEEDQWKDHGSDGKQHQEALFISSEYKRMARTRTALRYVEGELLYRPRPMRTFALLKNKKRKKKKKKRKKKKKKKMMMMMMMMMKRKKKKKKEKKKKKKEKKEVTGETKESLESLCEDSR
jgi:hypothetical protein